MPNIIINSGNQIIVSSGLAPFGPAIINSGGSLIISSGGFAADTSINSGGSLIISSGGVAADTSINSGGELILEGSATLIDVSSGGNLIVLSGGNANGNVISSGASLVVSSGGTVHNADILSGVNLIVSAGASAPQTTISSGASLVVSSGGNADRTVIYSGGSLIVLSGGNANGNVISSGASLVVSSGGNVDQMSLLSGASFTVSSGLSITSTNILSTANMDILSGGNAISTIINSSGSVIVSSGGSADQTKVGNYGGLTVLSGAKVTNTSTGFLGSITVSSGASIDQTTVGYNSDVMVLSGASINNATVDQAGRLTISSGGKNEGTISISPGGILTIYSDAGGVVNLLGAPSFSTYGSAGVFISGLENGGVVTTIINNFIGQVDKDEDNNDYIASDYIIIPGVKTSNITNVSYEDANGNANGDFVSLALNNGKKITLNIPGIQDKGYHLDYNSDDDLFFEVCFLAGSMIRTTDGNVAVEDLCIGDEILTFDWQKNKGVAQRVRWVGSKTVTVNPTLHDDESGYPVRILKDAIADGVPSKDLLITPEHCLFFDGKFTPARMLVNGYSIFYDYSITNYTYYHFETEEHSVIWANDMLTESYLDTGNQTQFKQHGDFAILIHPKKPKTWEQDAGAPLMVDRGYVEPLYNTLLQRAMKLDLPMKQRKQQLTHEPDFYLIRSDGLLIDPTSNFQGRYIFDLPDEEIKNVYLISRTSRLNDVVGPFEDNRHELGVLIGNIQIVDTTDNIQVINITDHLTQDDLPGWHALEGKTSRWTKGKALLAIPGDNHKGQKMIIHICSDRLYPLKQKQPKSIAV